MGQQAGNPQAKPRPPRSSSSTKTSITQTGLSSSCSHPGALVTSRSANDRRRRQIASCDTPSPWRAEGTGSALQGVFTQPRPRAVLAEGGQPTLPGPRRGDSRTRSIKLAAERASLRASPYGAAVVRGGFAALQVVAMEALQLVGLQPQLVADFSRIRRRTARVRSRRSSGNTMAHRPLRWNRNFSNKRNAWQKRNAYWLGRSRLKRRPKINASRRTKFQTSKATSPTYTEPNQKRGTAGYFRIAMLR
jgi:hypothetical protein